MLMEFSGLYLKEVEQYRQINNFTGGYPKASQNVVWGIRYQYKRNKMRLNKNTNTNTEFKNFVDANKLTDGDLQMALNVIWDTTLQREIQDGKYTGREDQKAIEKLLPFIWDKSLQDGLFRWAEITKDRAGV